MTETPSQVRGIGIVGAGRVARDHAYAVQSNPKLHFAGIAEPDASRAEPFAARFDCPAYADHRRLLEREEVDLVLIGVPHWLHAPIALDALAAGKHVLIEKPMAMTLDECDAMIEAADANGCRLLVGHTQHFFAANLATRQMLLSGQLGKIVQATQHWYKPFGLADRPPWMLDRATGGGMWFMNGAHMLDILLWLIDSEVVAVKGSITNEIIGQDAPDSIIALLEFANGAVATLSHSGFKRPADHGPAEQWLTTEISATEGMVKTVSYEGQIWLNNSGEYVSVPSERDAAVVERVTHFVNEWSGAPAETPVARSVIEEVAGVADELAAFVDAIETGGPSPISNQYARRVMQVLLAVEESSRTQREVRLDAR